VCLMERQLAYHCLQFPCYGYGCESQLLLGLPHTTACPPHFTCKLDRIRQEEFSRLEQHHSTSAPGLSNKGSGAKPGGPERQQHTVYLDHAGSALYSERQLEEVFQELRSVLFSNPHRCVNRCGKAVNHLLLCAGKRLFICYVVVSAFLV